MKIRVPHRLLVFGFSVAWLAGTSVAQSDTQLIEQFSRLMEKVASADDPCPYLLQTRQLLNRMDPEVAKAMRPMLEGLGEACPAGGAGNAQGQTTGARTPERRLNPERPVSSQEETGTYSFPVDENGRSCLAENHGRSVEQQSQPGMWEHSVRVTNRCNRAFQVKICYEGTRDCYQITLAPGRETSASMGVRRVQHFQYTMQYVR